MYDVTYNIKKAFQQSCRMVPCQSYSTFLYGANPSDGKTVSKEILLCYISRCSVFHLGMLLLKPVS